MSDIEYMKGTVFAKKVGETVQIFEGSGFVGDESPVLATGTTTPRMLKDRFADVVNVKDFGAVGDGVTDDTEAIQTALNAAKTSKKICFGEGTFLISETVQIDCSCNFSAATFNVHGATVTPAIKVGQTETTHSTLLSGMQIRLPRVINLDKPSTGFAGVESSVGVQMLNLFSAEIHVQDIVGFYKGLYLTASQTGHAWNTYFINKLTSNKVNLAIYPVGSGWVNQNTFIGGRFQADDTSDKFTQISIGKESQDAGSWGPNNNVFIGCDLSGLGVDYAIDCSGCYNYFYGCRFEYGVKVRFKSGYDGDLVAYNGVYGGLNAEVLAVEVDSALGGTVRNNDVDAPSRKLFDFFSKNNFLALGRQLQQGVYARFYPPGVNVTQAKETDSDWLHEISSTGIKTKRYHVTPYPNVSLSNEVKISSGSNDTDGVVIKQSLDRHVLFGGNLFTSVSPEVSSGGSLGSQARLWSQVYAATATISTSDERLKQDVAVPQDALLKAIQSVDFRVFRFKDSVEKKGDAARIHVGVVAQEVQAVFAAQGLNAADYGLFCYDEWGDEYEDVEVVDQPEVLGENGEVVTPAATHTERRKVLDAGNRFGIRYTELLALTCASLAKRLDKIEKALAEKGINLE